MHVPRAKVPWVHIIPCSAHTHARQRTHAPPSTIAQSTRASCWRSRSCLSAYVRLLLPWPRCVAVRNLWQHKKLLPPTSTKLRRWAFFLRILLIVNLVCIPIDLCFYHLPPSVKQNFDIIDHIINVFFILDFLSNFRRTYKNLETNELKTDLNAIARRYLRGWAAVDFVGAMPWEVTGVRQLKLIKLMRVTHVYKTRSGTTGKNLVIKRVLHILLNFLIGAHWVGCMWWFIGSYETDQSRAALLELELDPNNYRGSWLQRINVTKWNSKLATPLDQDSGFMQQYWSSCTCPRPRAAAAKRTGEWGARVATPPQCHAAAPPRRQGSLRCGPLIHAPPRTPAPSSPPFPHPSRLRSVLVVHRTCQGAVDRTQHHPGDAVHLVRPDGRRHLLRIAPRLDRRRHPGL